MKLLFDQNLSYHLVARLADLFPSSVHVREVGLAQASDDEVWAYAQRHRLVIVSKDADFRELSFVRGYPPKVIWIRCGNCSRRDVEVIVHTDRREILQFVDDEETSFLALK